MADCSEMRACVTRRFTRGGVVHLSCRELSRFMEGGQETKSSLSRLCTLFVCPLRVAASCSGVSRDTKGDTWRSKGTRREGSDGCESLIERQPYVYVHICVYICVYSLTSQSGRMATGGARVYGFSVYHAGMSFAFIPCGCSKSSCGLKSKRGGSGPSFGSRVSGSLNSSKSAIVQPSSGLRRVSGL